MRRMHAIMWLVGVLIVGGGALPGLSPTAAADETSGVLLRPSEGAVYENWMYDVIMVDLSEAGDNDPDHRWEVSFRDADGPWRVLTTVWGTGRKDIDAPDVGPGSYAVRVDPLWLDDSHTEVHEFTVTYDPYVYISSTIDHREAFFYGQTSVFAYVSYPAEPREGELVRWVIYRFDGGCGYNGAPQCSEVLSGTIVPAGGSERVDLPVADLPGGRYKAVIYRVLDETDRWEDFFDVLPPPEATDVSARPRTFYPHIDDGYRDQTWLRWHQNLDAHAVVEVRRDGEIVRIADLRMRPTGDHRWAWDGRDDTGKLVRPGTYRMRVRVTDGADNTDIAVTKVKVATGTVTRRAVIERRGPRTSARTKAGNCGFRTADRRLTLACSGGRHAKATYVYRLPRGAFDVAWAVRGRRSCCAPGRVITAGKRRSFTRYRVMVKVTNRRSYTVAETVLIYRYKERR